MLDEKVCKELITEPNGVTVKVARAINEGDFQASCLCKGCKCNCDDNGEEWS